MKVRDGGYSSLRSFAISKDKLTSAQISMIVNHIDVCQSFVEWKHYDYTDEYTVYQDEDIIYGDVTIDNFPMLEFLEKIIEIDMDYVHWLRDFDVSSILLDEILERDKKTTIRTRISKRKPKLEQIDKNGNL